MKLHYSRDSWEYNVIYPVDSTTVRLQDNLGGFDSDFENLLLRSFDNLNQPITIYSEYILDHAVKNRYPNLDIKFDAELMIQQNHHRALADYAKFQLHNPLDTTKVNFLCCFNQSKYQGREWLVSWLHELGWFDHDFCSKHFEIFHPPQEVQYLYLKYVGDNYNQLHKKISRNQFSKTIIKFGSNIQRHTHADNLTVLSSQHAKSFVNLVAETDPAHMIPFPTEKFLFPIVNKTLWVAYAQPLYHEFVASKMGFRRYSCFDYGFDHELDHVERLGKLTAMLNKFSSMATDAWQEIYNQEKETIEFNFEHVASGAFMTHLRQFDQAEQKSAAYT